jgi:cell division protein FtsL
VFKLLTMLVMFLMVALMLLSLRQRRLELTSESSAIYGQIRERNETLYGLHVEIAKITNPWALADTWKKAGMNTGGAFDPRRTSVGRPTPSVETDLTAPIRGNQ